MRRNGNAACFLGAARLHLHDAREGGEPGGDAANRSGANHGFLRRGGVGAGQLGDGQAGVFGNGQAAARRIDLGEIADGGQRDRAFGFGRFSGAFQRVTGCLGPSSPQRPAS